MDIVKYREDSEKFLYKRDKEYYLHFSGQKESLNVGKISEEFRHLFSLDNINWLRDLKEKTSGEEKRKNASLLKFCVEGFIELQVKDLVDRIAADEAKAKIVIDGKKISFRYSEILLTNEADKARRDDIDDKRNKVVAEYLNADLYKYWSTIHGLAVNLGFTSYSELFSYLNEVDFSALEYKMEKLLVETDSLYESHFSTLFQMELGIPLSRSHSRRSDFAFLKRARKYDKFFKKDALVPLFKDTLSEMGIDMSKYNNIYFDVEERENKSPRAFCCTPDVPSEIYLVVMPSGGQDDYEALFHEGGHALHFGSTSPELDFEYRYLGDNAVTEGYAFYMELLMQNREWLMDFAGMDENTAVEFAYFSNLLKLWFCRRYAGKLKYELVLHDGSPIEGKESVYREILSGVNLMEYPEENYLRDVDDGFYCADYIRAWIFQSQLKVYIYDEFGYNWYRKKKAGSFLRELWNYGQKYTADEILSQLGFGGIDVNYLIGSLIDDIKNF
jgi:hypothetical protein